MLIIILYAIGLLLLLFIYSTLIVSSRCSRKEEEYEHFKDVQKIIKRR